MRLTNPESSARLLPTPPPRRNPVVRWARGAAREIEWPLSVPVLILTALLVLYIALQPSALSVGTLTSNLNDALPLIFVCAGQTIVIISGGIDLSVGGVVSLINVLAATHLTGGVPALIGWSLVLVLLGLAVGTLNGVLIALGNLSAVIVTIATWSIGGGIALFILASPGGNVARADQDFWSGATMGWPNALTAILILVIGWRLLRRTRTGVSLYAVGSDAEAARLTGVVVWRARLLAYALSGGLSALAGLVLAADTATGDPTVGTPFILNSIAAAVIGGTAITGGRGGVTRGALGACIFTVVGDVLFAASVSPFLTPLVTGLVLIVVVGITVLAPVMVMRLRRRGRP